MRRTEISRRFDEIVTFAGVERFIDTPLKHFSTGMQMRLAFAVAAHLEPEILLVDEVLAVGDIEFQKKCLGKMQDVSKSGRTIVLVSHQMNQIRRLCGRAFWIDGGRIREEGPANQIVGVYESEMSSGTTLVTRNENRKSAKAQFTRWSIQSSSLNQSYVLASTGAVKIGFEIVLNAPLHIGHHGIALYNSDRNLVWGTAVNHLELASGTHSFVHNLPSLPLRPGPYTWRVSLFDEHGLLDDWQCVPEMLVATEPVTHPSDEWAGILNIPETFSVFSESDERK